MRRLCQTLGRDNLSLSPERERFFGKSDPYLESHNFASIKDTDLIDTAIDRYLLDLSKNVLEKFLVTI